MTRRVRIKRLEIDLRGLDPKVAEAAAPVARGADGRSARMNGWRQMLSAGLTRHRVRGTRMPAVCRSIPQGVVPPVFPTLSVAPVIFPPDTNALRRLHSVPYGVIANPTDGRYRTPRPRRIIGMGDVASPRPTYELAKP